MPGYRSTIRPNEYIIDDTTNVDQITPAWVQRGYIPRNWELKPPGSVAAPFPVPVIPRSEWSERIRDRERQKQLNSKIWELQGVVCLNQGQTNYCWANAVITAIYMLRALMGLPFVKLSPASVAAVIKQFSNVGGFGGEALLYIAKHGVVPQDKWPANAIDQRYYTKANLEIAAEYKITDWWELQPYNFDQLMTCLLLGLPVPVALMWWGHEVCGLDPIVTGRDEFGARIKNSWGADWGDNGNSIILEPKLQAADQIAPSQVMATVA